MYHYYLFPCVLNLLWTAAYCQEISFGKATNPSCRAALELAACRALDVSGRSLPQACLSRSSDEPPNNLRSCKEIHCAFPSVPSGRYQIQLSNGSIEEVYCDMEGSNCGGEGGWTRVALVNMTEPGATCPQGLTQRILSELTLCDMTVGGNECEGTLFSTLDINYQQVCGQLRGYQFGTPEAFSRSIDFPTLPIDNNYLDGASVTYGNSPREHIWSYTSGVTVTSTNRFGCPCNSGTNVQLPSFVGNDYYCESAATTRSLGTFYPNDPLWDGQQCTGNEGPCCTNPNLPWFEKTLAASTNENIELRLCRDESGTNEGVPLEIIELFIR